MEEQNEFLSTDEVKALVRVRLDMEEEFTAGRKKKSVLWNKVVEKVKKIKKDIKIDRNLAQRKFLNLLVTYKRIKKRYDSSGRGTTSWIYFDEFDKVYGARHSVTPPSQNLLALLELQPSIPAYNNENVPPNSPPTSSRRVGRSCKKSSSRVLKFFEDDAINAQRRHEEAMALEREKLSLEKRRIETMLELKVIFQKFFAK